jgi:predicted alpha/beta-fold hydrolase
MSDPGPFRPAWWCRSGHAQTVWAATLRPSPELPGCRRQRWETPDGDFLDVDHLDAKAGRPILLIVHGLEGSSRAQQVRGFLRAAHRRRWRAVALNFRSCSGELNRLPRSYHGGDTTDLGWVIARLIERHPGDPICGVGLSLGGNVLLKYLGEPGEVPAALKAAAAISAPFDLKASARAFEEGFWNRIYMRRLIRSLKQKTLAKLARYPDLLDPQRLDAVRTIREFDEAVTAPLNGFASADAYWASSSCRQFLGSITRPTLLINALDDPLVPAEALARREVAGNRWLTAARPHGGGHVGFISGKQPSRPVFWAEEMVFGFFAKAVSGSEPGRPGVDEGGSDGIR